MCIEDPPHQASAHILYIPYYRIDDQIYPLVGLKVALSTPDGAWI